MKFSVDRNVFLEGVQRTLGIVERKTTIPILSNILIEAAEGRIRIVATDREIGLIADYQATVEREGKITVAARKLFEMIREIEGGTVSFEKLDNNWVHVTCDKVNYRIPGIPADDFPEIAGDEGQTYFPVRNDILREMIGKTFFAVSNDEMRPSLNGVHFSTEKGRLEMVATDGHRLSMVAIDADDEAVDAVVVEGVIIPRKGVGEIRKLIEGDGESVQLGFSEGRCYIKVDGTLLRINLIDADYPDFRKVIPKEEGVEVLLDRRKLLHALRRMSVMSSERFSGVKIEMTADKMILSSINPDVGEAKDEIEVSFDGEGFEVGYSVRYLIDAIDVITEESVSFEMRGSEGPGIIRPVGNETYTYVVMPIKLREE